MTTPTQDRAALVALLTRAHDMLITSDAIGATALRVEILVALAALPSGAASQPPTVDRENEQTRHSKFYGDDNGFGGHR